MSSTYGSLVGHWADGYDLWNTWLNTAMFKDCEEYVEYMKRQVPRKEYRKGKWATLRVDVYECDESPAKYVLFVPIPYYSRNSFGKIHPSERFTDLNTITIKFDE